MKTFNHICVLFSEPLEASLRFLMMEVLNARPQLYSIGADKRRGPALHARGLPELTGSDSGRLAHPAIRGGLRRAPVRPVSVWGACARGR